MHDCTNIFNIDHLNEKCGMKCCIFCQEKDCDRRCDPNIMTELKAVCRCVEALSLINKK